MVAKSTDLVGYSLYLDLLGPLAKGKARHDFDLGKEEARVVHAMELAGQGRDVALVCSGDAGIYAMATLVSNCSTRAAFRMRPRGSKCNARPVSRRCKALRPGSARRSGMISAPSRSPIC